MCISTCIILTNSSTTHTHMPVHTYIIRMYLHICIYIYVYTYTYVYTYMYIHLCIYMHIHIQISKAFAYICIYMHIHIQISKADSLSAHMHVCLHPYICTHARMLAPAHIQISKDDALSAHTDASIRAARAHTYASIRVRSERRLCLSMHAYVRHERTRMQQAQSTDAECHGIRTSPLSRIYVLHTYTYTNIYVYIHIYIYINIQIQILVYPTCRYQCTTSIYTYIGFRTLVSIPIQASGSLHRYRYQCPEAYIAIDTSVRKPIQVQIVVVHQYLYVGYTSI